MPMPRPQLGPVAVGCSSGPPRQTDHRIYRVPPRWPVSAIRWAVGVSVIWRTVAAAGRRHRARVARGAVPPAARVAGLTMATRKPATLHGPATRWSLDDLVAALLPQRLQPLRRSSLWRIREAADRKPQRRVSGLHSHAPDGAAKAPDLGPLSVQARRCSQQGRLGICAEEKSGRQRLPRRSPTLPVQPGTPEQRAHAYLRQGVRAFLAACVVPPGQRGWHLGHTRPSADWAAPLAPGGRPLPARQRYDGVVEHLTPHGSRAVCRLVAPWGAVPLIPQARPRGAQRRAFLCAPPQQPVLHFPPQHGSWLNPVEWWWSVLARRFLKRGADASAHDVATRLSDSLEVYNTHPAHP